MRNQTVGLAAILALAAAGWGQYPGQVDPNAAKDQPVLRAISVLEWTGDAGTPKSSRLIPVAIFDGQSLQDAGVYLARPQPLAVYGQVRYELSENGKNIGLYDIHSAGQQLGAWVGFGVWRPLPKPKPVQAQKSISSDFDEEDDKPTLHRKHHAGDSSKGGSAGSSPSGSGDGSGSAGKPADSGDDRPTLHRKPSDTSSSGSGTSSSGTSTSGSDSPDDRPTLHRKDSGESSGGNASGNAPSDTDRPVLHKQKEAAPTESDDDLPAISDPDRPRLVRGKPAGSPSDDVPSLIGLPEELHQTVAVSDVRTLPEHIYSFSWSNPADEQRLKEELEAMAREALGIAPPPAAAPAKPRPRAGARHAVKKPAAAPAPVPLADEDFRVFELSYGAGATLVLTASAPPVDPAAPVPAPRKFVTLIAQPDLYGHVRVLMKSVTDAAHLDLTPRMRLVDAVDALADNRAELLFELRGSAQRQFALYRIYRGQVEKLFSTGGDSVEIRPAG